MPTTNTTNTRDTDPDRNGTWDPGTTPQEHQRILAAELSTHHQQRRHG